MQKILVTLGPSSLTKEVVQDCDKSDVYLYRINLSHTDLQDVAKIIKRIKMWTSTPICLDSEGAQLRNQKMKLDWTTLVKGEEVYIHFDEVIGDKNNLSLYPIGVAKQLVIGDIIRLDFNHARLKVVKIKQNYCTTIVEKSGSIGSNKAADVNRKLNFDSLTQKDLNAIAVAKQLGVTNFALSFTNTKKDVELMRKICGPEANIICKIESEQGLLNLPEILQMADQILIDRGDLSRQIPIEKIPFLQRIIIAKANEESKPVFVATNLLESMVTQQTPNRAEVNDAVSSLEMGASGLVLAAETAIGKFPADAVRMIRKLIMENHKFKGGSTFKSILEG